MYLVEDYCRVMIEIDLGASEPGRERTTASNQCGMTSCCHQEVTGIDQEHKHVHQAMTACW